MKKTIYIAWMLLTAATLGTSCSMDFDPTGSYSDKTFWYSAKNAESGLVGCYLPLRNGSMFGGMAIAMEECATPNAYNYANTLNWNDLAKGSHTADGTIFAGRWKDAYTGIGRCNLLLANIDLNTELSSDRIVQMKAQARFLRALYYSVLTTYYYAVPLITESPDISQVGQTRTDRAEILRFIFGELDQITRILPPFYSAQGDKGRPTAGSALALKARLKLFEASPLNNPDNKPEPWAEAAQAAWEVMDLGIHSLYRSNSGNDYAELFTEVNEYSSESIFDVEAISLPTGLGHSMDIVMRQYNSAAPLKGFVDEYWMKDGKPRNESGFAASNGYADMDPRFYMTIVHPGSKWMGETVKTDQTNVKFTNKQTGFIYKKYTVYTQAAPSDKEANLNENCSPINIMLLRYADVLLMYAEAMNEQGKLTEEIWNKTVRAIRLRAGFTLVQALDYPGNDMEILRRQIRYERRVELAGEGTWYNDLRRWKLAETEMNNLSIRMHDGTQIGTRSFNKARDYWWPVPSSQMETAPTLGPNNPGW